MNDQDVLKINDILELVKIEYEISGAEYVDPIDNADVIGDIKGLFDRILRIDSNDHYHLAMGLTLLSLACAHYASKVNPEELKQLLNDRYDVSSKLYFKNIIRIVKKECEMTFVSRIKDYDFNEFKEVVASFILLYEYLENKDDNYHVAKILIIISAACVTYTTSLEIEAVKRLIKNRYHDKILHT
ncbi:hypothetical protein LEP1GSC170_1457 [Leptospira interrogans serovar Bataviae str. HAI135]|nr:hypothetical protein LEP1GSC170_1457 [Leptospira interrogans serovar Bataviae str. HAI135]